MISYNDLIVVNKGSPVAAISSSREPSHILSTALYPLHCYINRSTYYPPMLYIYTRYRMRSFPNLKVILMPHLTLPSQENKTSPGGRGVIGGGMIDLLAGLVRCAFNTHDLAGAISR